MGRGRGEQVRGGRGESRWEAETARCREPAPASPPRPRPPPGAVPIPAQSAVRTPCPARPLRRLDLVPRCPSFASFPQRLRGSCPQSPRLPSLPRLRPPAPTSFRPDAPLPRRLVSLEPESVPPSPGPAASQPVPSHRCPHVRPSIRPSLLRPALTMPSGCRCLHLVCLLCILGAPVQPAGGERAPGLGSRPCPAIPRLRVDLCRPETALQPPDPRA